LADHLLLSVRPFASPGHGRITPPGRAGGYGRDIDGLEGFARTLLLAGFRIAGGEDDPHHFAEWYAEGLAEGSDPDSPWRWVRPDEDPQAKVEAASLALILDLDRAKLWDPLDERVKERIVDYLSPVVGDPTYPRNNWCWFRICVETFLRSVGGPWSPDDVEADLALHDSFVREMGWLSDGDGRCFDHYVGWALHLYPTLWQNMLGAHDLADDARRRRDFEALDRYLLDAVHLVGADGGPLVQGRSLIYRTAAAAPFWVGALAQVPSTGPGLLRRAASGVARHFLDHGAPDRDGLYTMGWFHEWRRLAQSYSGPGSPYWAAKGFLGLALDKDHPAWTAPEQPLPVEQGDFARAIEVPGWIAVGTKADGVVRVANHGTDHAEAGDRAADSPLYARLGYSTATSPLLDEDAWTTPLEQSAALLDGLGRASHRAGMVVDTLVTPPGRPAYIASSGDAHWFDFDPEQQQHHGSGRTGTPTRAGRLAVVSVLSGSTEVRGVKVSDPSPAARTLRVGGWPTVAGDGLLSSVTPLSPGGTPGELVRDDASPLGTPAPLPGGTPLLGTPAPVPDHAPPLGTPAPLPGEPVPDDPSPLGTSARVPYVDYPVRPGQWVWTLIELRRVAASQPTSPLRREDKEERETL
jgi:hypothetical protein